MTQREELIDRITQILAHREPEYFIEDLADFILADRARIIAPLVKAKNNKLEPYVWDAIDEVLKLAGVDHD